MRPPQYFPPVQHAPLDPPLALTGTFGEYRQGHFHAGVDLSTGEVTGKPVYASLPGYIIRLRSSGAGYGRSIYLQADDGRLLVYGHLDAFDEPFASYVDQAQRDSARYEQDLWPDTTRFRVTAGQRLGWSGRSGTGPPHLHFEIRRGDVAYNPLLAGLTVVDTVPPLIRRVVVQRSSCSPPDSSITVVGLDRRGNGRWTMAPWRIEVTMPARTAICSFDSASWAEGMSEVDEVYDRGRVLSDSLGAYGVRVWSSAWAPPRVVRTGPSQDAAGITVAVIDAAGGRSEFKSAWPQVTTPCTDALPGVRVAPEGEAHSDRSWLPLHWQLPAHAAFEAEHVDVRKSAAPRDTQDLKSIAGTVLLGPARTTFRVPARVAFDLPAHARADRIGLYRDSGDGWEYLGSDLDSTHTRIIASSRQLGRFALFRDARSPRITVLPPPSSTSSARAYSTWALEAKLDEQGSGVDRAKSTWFVDGKPVASEWDGEVATLRWRPLHPPAKGTHHYEAVAADRAGNVAKKRGTFVIN